MIIGKTKKLKELVEKEKLKAVVDRRSPLEPTPRPTGMWTKGT